jgi:hypothetical protein
VLCFCSIASQPVLLSAAKRLTSIREHSSSLDPERLRVLSMARDVIGRIGGEISAANRLSGGALVTLSLPRSDVGFPHIAKLPAASIYFEGLP